MTAAMTRAMTSDAGTEDVPAGGLGRPESDDVTGQFDRDVLLRCLADLG